MTIEKGRAWGTAAPLPPGGVVVHSDAGARAALEQARREGRPYPPLGLLGGDPCRTVGGPGDEGRLRSSEASTFTIDLGQVLVDGHLHLFVSHLVARTALWSRAFVAMNAQWHGSWNLGPRAHPGDGLLDTYDVRLGPSDLLRVRPRLHHGAHLPHPGIRERRLPADHVELGRPRAVRLDGVGGGLGRGLVSRSGG